MDSRQKKRTHIKQTSEKTGMFIFERYETIVKLANNDVYEKKDIEDSAKSIFEYFKYDNNNFEVVNETSFDIISKKTSETSVEEPIFFVFEKEKGQWIFFFIIKQKKEYTIFYKDSSGSEILHSIDNFLKETYFDPKIVVHGSKDHNEEDSYLYGPACLRNIKRVLQLWKKDKEELTTNFTEIQFVQPKDILRDKKMMITEFAFRLSGEAEFKKELKIFINEMPTDLEASADNYLKVLEEEGNKEGGFNKERIQKAREKFINKKDLEKLANKIKIDKEGVTQFEIEKKFSHQMNQLKLMFLLLDKHKIDNAVLHTLRLICYLLDLDFDKLSPYYERLSKQSSEKHKKIVPDDIRELEKNIKKPFPPETEGLTPVDQLIEEIDLISEEDKKAILQKFHLVKEKCEEWKPACPTRINNWAIGMKGKLGHDDNEICETVAIMNSAVLAIHGFNLRDVQILGVLVFLHGRSDQGRLCQIQTGEGKTFIVSLLAVIRVLQGHTVDVITSNSVLAQDGVDECKKFYSVFNLTVATNNISPEDTYKFKLGYTADIVYGSISNFQFDYLRDNFEGLKIRGGRKFGQVILDEVDSMLVDNGGHIAKLAEPFPGMEYLRYVYIKIWQELHKAEKSFVDEVSTTMQKFIKEYPDKEEGKTLAEEYLRVATETEEAVIKDRLRKSQILEKIPIIPKHLQEFVRGKLSLWINNAAHAKYHCHENKQYRIMKNDEGERIIVPVDYQNTGISMKNTIWSNGLHQFVQLKHNVYLSFESMTSSFISNLGYIKLYEENNLYLFGMTGTLGSEAEQQLISDVYSVDYARLPTFKKKDFKELDGLIFENDRWHVELIITILKTVDKGRAILVVCETVQDLYKLKKKLECLDKEKIHVRIFANEESAGETKVKVQPGDIILATNIAGRGTNFKTSKDLEKNGGLHVCVGFLPNNKRVEDQAFGRTSRQGNSGTAQLIIRQSEVEALKMKEENPSYHLIKEERDKLERKRLENVRNTLVKELIFKDELFKYFSVEHRKEKKKSRTNPRHHYALKDFKEAWAFWLEKKNFKIDNIKRTTAEKEFKLFYHGHSDILSGFIHHNPLYNISLAEYYLESDELDEARKSLENAIKMSDHNSPALVGVYLKKFEVSIKSGHQLLWRFAKAVDLFRITFDISPIYKTQAKKDLQSALTSLQIELGYFEQNLANGKTNQLNSDFEQILIQEKSEFLEHIFSRYQLLKMHEQLIRDLMKKVDDWGGVGIKAKEPISYGSASHETMELQVVGLDTFYALKQIHDVPHTVISTALLEIGAGLAALGGGLICLPLLPLLGNLGAAYIADGVIDIVFELLSDGEDEFDEKAFIKGKLISAGLNVFVAIFSVVASAVKLVKRIANGCLRFARVFRRSKYFKIVTNILADALETFAGKISKTLDEIAKITFKVSKNRATLVKDLVKKALVATKKRFVTSIIREQVTKPLLAMSIDKILEEVYKLVGDTFIEAMKIKENLMEKLRTSSLADIKAAVSKFMETDFIRATCERIAKTLLGILHNSALNAVFAAINWVREALQLATFKNEFISHLQDTLPGGDSNNDLDKVIEDVSMEGAKTMISLFKDFIKGFKGVYTFDVKKALKSAKQLAHPLEILKVSVDASLDEINEKMRRIALEGNIDKNDYNKFHGLVQAFV